MRDSEKLLLDDHLHRVIMKHIYRLQSHFRTLLARKHYLKFRNGIIKLQVIIYKLKFLVCHTFLFNFLRLLQEVGLFEINRVEETWRLYVFKVGGVEYLFNKDMN